MSIIQWAFVGVCAGVIIAAIIFSIKDYLANNEDLKRQNNIKRALKECPYLTEIYQRWRVTEETYVLRRLEFNRLQKNLCCIDKINTDELKEERERYRQIQVELDKLRNEKIICENALLSLEKAYGIAKDYVVDLPVEVHYSDIGKNIADDESYDENLADKEFDENFERMKKIDKIIGEINERL